MTNVTKNGVVMGCRDDVQLAAFLNSGWEIVKEKKAMPKTEEPKKGKSKKEQ